MRVSPVFLLVFLVLHAFSCGGPKGSAKEILRARPGEIAGFRDCSARDASVVERPDAALAADRAVVLPDSFGDDLRAAPEAAQGSLPGSLMQMVSKEQYIEDLVFIAQERPPASPHWQAVQDLCKERFLELGYEVELHEFGEGINVVGTRPGDTLPDEHVIVSAHYDHLEGCAGADDNATGVAGTLEVARVLSTVEFPRTVIFACWDQEEWGLQGSKAYAKEARGRGDNIVAAFVFEMIGYASDEPNSQEIPLGFDFIFPEAVKELAEAEFRGNFVAVVADDFAHEPASLLVGFAKNEADLPAVVLELPQSDKMSAIFFDLRRSDHASFWMYDYPAMMITDTANFRNANYHCKGGPDTVDTLDHDFAANVIRATVAAAASTLGM